MSSNSSILSVCDDYRTYSSSLNITIYACGVGGVASGTAIPFPFDNLVRKLLPKLGEHFSQEVISPGMYASQWFITVFSYSFPFHLALRIWDVFLYEVSGLKAH